MEQNASAAPAADDGKGIPADMVEDAPATSAGEGAAPDATAQAEQEFARRLGWRPPEEYRGPTHKFVDAKAFIDKTQSEAPLLRSQLRRQDEKLQQQERLLKDQGEALNELLSRSRGAEARGFEYAMERVEADMEEAVRNADQDSYKRLKQQRDELQKLKPAAKDARKPDEGVRTDNPAPRKPPDPAQTAWAQENQWFFADKKLARVAEGIELALIEEEPYLSTADRLAKVTGEIKRRFPEKFENGARNNPPAAALPGPQGARPIASKKTKTFDDIPAAERDAARSTFALLQRRNPKLTSEQYLKDYK